MLFLFLHAPFAACRTFTAGWYRPSAPFLTPSAAYGILLNIAGIETRLCEHETAHDGCVAASLNRLDRPSFRVAIGLPDGADPPGFQSLFQQLHNYPVGAQAGVPPEMAMGNKNNITPVRRELLTNLKAVIAVDATGNAVEDRIQRGLRGDFNSSRYGLPFVGDNSFLINRLELVSANVPMVRWYERIESADGTAVPAGGARLTIDVDRADMSRTRSALYAPSDTATQTPPDAAWSHVGPVADTLRP